jgi:hypothetical protein
MLLVIVSPVYHVTGHNSEGMALKKLDIRENKHTGVMQFSERLFSFKNQPFGQN